MVLKKLKHAINRLTGRSKHEMAQPIHSGKEIIVNLKDPYKQPDKNLHKPIKVDAPFTIEPSSTRNIKLEKVVHKSRGRARIKLRGKPMKRGRRH